MALSHSIRKMRDLFSVENSSTFITKMYLHTCVITNFNMIVLQLGWKTLNVNVKQAEQPRWPCCCIKGLLVFVTRVLDLYGDIPRGVSRVTPQPSGLSMLVQLSSGWIILASTSSRCQASAAVVGGDDCVFVPECAVAFLRKPLHE